MKYFSIIKDFFMVFSDFKDADYRPSESMITNVIFLISAGLLLAFGLDFGISEVEAAAMATAVMSVVGIVLRYRSKGGEVKLKVEKKEAKIAKILEEE